MSKYNIINGEVQEKEKKSRGITPTQKSILNDFMARHPELRSGKFSNTFTNANARALWQDVAIALNGAEGPKKEWQAWRKTYHDLKGKVKKAAAEMEKSRRQTGGGPLVEISLTPEDEVMLSILDPVSIYGLPNLKESLVDMAFDEAVAANEQMEQTNTNDDSDDFPPFLVKLTDSPKSLNTEILEKNDVAMENFKTESEQDGPLHLENKENPTISVKEELKRAKRPTPAARLDDGIKHASEMTMIMNKDMQNKKMYWDRKIQIMEQNLLLNTRTATALEQIANRKLKIMEQNLLVNARKARALEKIAQAVKRS